MKIEIPASKSKETVPSPFIPNPDYPVRVPVQEQRYVANRKNPTIFFCSGFLIGLFVAVIAILTASIVFPNENVFGICLGNEEPTNKSNPDFNNPDNLKQVILTLAHQILQNHHHILIDKWASFQSISKKKFKTS